MEKSGYRTAQPQDEIFKSKFPSFGHKDSQALKRIRRVHTFTV